MTFEPNYVSSLDGLYHWSSLPIKIYFEMPGEWANHYSPDLPENAALSWNVAGAKAFFSVVIQPDEATVQCAFVEYPLEDWGANAQAITYYAYYVDSHLLVPGKVSIVCAWRDPSGRLLSPELMQAVIAHELGHALGIAGHSPNTDDLMYAQLQRGLITPQERDLNTAKTAYYSYFSDQSAEPTFQPPTGTGDIVYRSIE